MRLIPIMLFCILMQPITKGLCQDTGKVPDKRLSPVLRSVLVKAASNDSLDIIVAVKGDKKANLKNSRLLYEYAPSHTVVVRASAAHIKTLLDDAIIFADVVRKPKEELTTGAFDLSANKINSAQNNNPFINGNSIQGSVKEQQFDTTDIDIKGRFFHSGIAAATQSSHAAIMATIIAGAGNSSPFARGVAPGSTLGSSDFAVLLPDPDTIYRHFAISFQNHSYGTAIENYYGADAAAYDMSVWNNPSLVHIFSAGNSGTSAAATGAYANITAFANITGSFKMAKNIITVGHIDSFYNVLPLSSRGPAFDGRIKPELVAFGEDGSSGAAALVSGTVALLQQAYKTTHTNHLPSASLVKAALLNAADAISAKGINYQSGYGSLNAAAALKTILENRFFEDTLSNLQTKKLSFTIPPHTSQLKVTLVWTDTAAQANATKALVNDLDAVLTQTATGKSWLPWTLNSTPEKDSLEITAIRNKDSLNNVEQISVDAPEAGTYDLEVTGSHVITSLQPFSVAYQLDNSNHFEWTYPTASDVLRAAERNVVRWQTTIPGKAAIEFSMNGTSWQTIDSDVNLSDGYYKWDTPDTMTTALLRIKVAAIATPFTSDTFTLSTPAKLNVGFNCADSFLIFWNKQPVSQYQLYQLGDKYLQPVFTTTDTFSVLKKSQYPSLYYAVAPIVANKTALRSYTINYTDQGVSCYLRTFLTALQNNTAVLTAEVGTSYNITSVTFQKLTTSGIQTVQTIASPSTTAFTATDAALTRGVNRYRLAIQLTSGAIIYSDIETVYYFPDLPVIIYPNPARQNEPVTLIVNMPFTYFIQVFDATGKRVMVQKLDSFTSQIQPFVLSKGMYFIKILSPDGNAGVQKLIVQ